MQESLAYPNQGNLNSQNGVNKRCFKREKNFSIENYLNFSNFAKTPLDNPYPNF